MSTYKAPGDSHLEQARLELKKARGERLTRGEQRLLAMFQKYRGAAEFTAPGAMRVRRAVD